MPVIIILIFIIYRIASTIYNELTRNRRIYTHDEIKAMNRAMIGKSKSEKKMIYKIYKNNVNLNKDNKE